MQRRVLMVLSLVVMLLMVGLSVGFMVGPAIVDRAQNTIVAAPAVPETDSARALHRELFVVDLHADELLWGRDPLKQSARGHTDVPRLRMGNVALQVFSVVTKTPRGINYDRNTGATDNILLLAMLQRWPVSTWRSLRARALYQANRLHAAAAQSNGSFTVITSRASLDAFLMRRVSTPGLVAGLLAIEGLQALDGRLESVDTLYHAGFRMMGLTHFFDNEVAASAHGVSHAGLTAFGRAVVTRMEALHIVVDLAHASPQTMRDVLAIATQPVVVSHTGVQATCPGPRNLTDDELRAIAVNGGVIGIGYWDAAVCEPGARSVARAMRHAVDVAGIEHVALGSDFDGATRMPFDTTELPQITAALLVEHFTPQEIGLLMGGNALRLLRDALPQ